MLKPRYVPLTPQIYADALREVETAADMITHVGHVVRPALGVKWDSNALKVYRKIMEFQFQLKQAIEDERLAIQAGKGQRSPNGTRKERNFQKPRYQEQNQ